jgi:hypothetical protein
MRRGCSDSSVETLARRLSRAPQAYAWPDLLVSEHAVVGVWLAGEFSCGDPEPEALASQGLYVDPIYF